MSIFLSSPILAEGVLNLVKMQTNSCTISCAMLCSLSEEDVHIFSKTRNNTISSVAIYVGSNFLK